MHLLSIIQHLILYIFVIKSEIEVLSQCLFVRLFGQFVVYLSFRSLDESRHFQCKYLCSNKKLAEGSVSKIRNGGTPGYHVFSDTVASQRG